MTQSEIIEKTIDAFEDNGVPYMLTGAIAVNYYGKPRLTHDVDLVVQIQMEDAQKIVKLFEKEFYVSIDGIIDAVSHTTMFNLISLKVPRT